MTWTYDPKLDPKENLQVVLTNIDASIFAFCIFCLIISCIVTSRSPFSLQDLTIVLSSKRGDILILFIVFALSFEPNPRTPFSLPPYLACVTIPSTLQWSMKSLFHFFGLWQWVPSPLALQFSRNLPPLLSFFLVSSFPPLP